MFIIRGWVKQPHTDDKNTSYEVTAFINAKPIWQGVITGHDRANGLAVLLAKIANKIKRMKPDAKKSLEEELAKGYSIELEANRVKCPTCNRHISRTHAPACPKCGTQKLSCRNGCTWETDS